MSDECLDRLDRVGGGGPCCFHVAGSNAPKLVLDQHGAPSPARRVEQISECCWCGCRVTVLHGPHLRDCNQPGSPLARKTIT
jgi:hypothetical protein